MKRGMCAFSVEIVQGKQLTMYCEVAQCAMMHKCKDYLREKFMNKDEYVKFKKEDVQKAYDEGCEDVQSTLRKMCPEILEKKYCCEWMKETIKHGLIKDTNGKHHRFAYNQDALTDHMYENVIYYCPRCGKKGSDDST